MCETTVVECYVFQRGRAAYIELNRPHPRAHDERTSLCRVPLVARCQRAESGTTKIPKKIAKKTRGLELGKRRGRGAVLQYETPVVASVTGFTTAPRGVVCLEWRRGMCSVRYKAY